MDVVDRLEGIRMGGQVGLVKPGERRLDSAAGSAAPLPCDRGSAGPLTTPPATATTRPV
jgi:hypothetical protein